MTLQLEQSYSLILLVLFAVQASLQPSVAFLPMVLVSVVSIILAAVTLSSRLSRLRSLATLGAFLSLGQALGLLWQLTMIVSIALSAVVCRRSPFAPLHVLQRGSIPPRLTSLAAAVTPIGLVSWVILAHPNLDDILHSPHLQHPLWLLLIGALVFAVLNAVCEEWIWRGVYQSTLRELWSEPISIVLSALSFGAQHMHGFPRGLLGVALAGSWGALLGVVRSRSRGLLAATLAHIVADASIAVIVLVLVRSR